MSADLSHKNEAFKKVFETHYNSLCNYAHQYIKENSACEDIVQEVFVRVWEKRSDLIGSDAIRFYLFTAVRNNCLTYNEKKKRELLIQSDEMGNQFGKLPDEKHDENNAYQPLIHKALSLLPPKCKEVFLLSRISNMSYKEIAQSLDISTKTVENQIAKALKILKSFIKDNPIPLLLAGIAFFRMITNSTMGDFTIMLFY